MTMSNKYINRSRISGSKFRHILQLFCLDIDAHTIAAITGLSRNTINRHVRLMRERIAELCYRSSPSSGEIEVDESYFGARRVRGVRGRGVHGKHIVFGLIKRGGRSTTRSSESVLPQSLCPLSGKKSVKNRSFIQMDLKPMMAWSILVTKSITVSSTDRTNSLTVPIILTVLRTFGPLQKQD